MLRSTYTQTLLRIGWRIQSDAWVFCEIFILVAAGKGEAWKPEPESSLMSNVQRRSLIVITWALLSSHWSVIFTAALPVCGGAKCDIRYGSKYHNQTS